MEKARVNGTSIRRLLLQPVLIVSVLTSAIFIISIWVSGVLQDLDSEAVELLHRTVNAHASELESTLLNAANLAENAAQELSSQLSEQVELQSIRDSEEVKTNILQTGSQQLQGLLASGLVSGAYICLDAPVQGQGSSVMTSLYLRNIDVSSAGEITGQGTVLQGSEELIQTLGLEQDENWTPAWDMSDAMISQVLTRPMRATQTSGAQNLHQFGYWSTPYEFDQVGQHILSYSVPIINAQGQALGVIGISFSTEHLSALLPYSSIDTADTGTYVFGNLIFLSDADTRVEIGPLAGELLPEEGAQLRIYNNQYNGQAFSVEGTDENLVATVAHLNLYYLSSPFFGNRFALYGIITEQGLFAASRDLVGYIVIGALLTIGIGVIISMLVSQYISQAIRGVVRKSAAVSGASGEIDLGRTGIREIDILVRTVEELGTDMMEFSKRTMETIKLTEMPIGVFELDRDANMVYINKVVADLCGIECEDEETFINLSAWEPLIKRLRMNRERSGENIYIYNAAGMDTRWLRIKTAQKGQKEYGIIMDVTADILEKMHLELERDIDPLTGLLNRNAFVAQAQKIIDAEPDKLGALIFADIDNLKRINDQYGHDVGNHYIFTVADIFRRFNEHGGVVGRMTGDEFAIYLHGYDTVDSLREILSTLISQTAHGKTDRPVGLNDGVFYSVGYALYPLHATGLDQLIRYADFAMYEIKHLEKGNIKEFDPDSYHKDQGLTHKKEVLTTFIESDMVPYAFQPIVSVQSGRVFAYEAFMRPHIDELHTPREVLELAKMQAKLYAIERMTYFNTLAWIKDNAYFLDGRSVFVNSIPGMLLSTRDMQELREKYEQYLPLLVTEITENEQSDDEFINTKVGSMRKWHSSIAVDRFSDNVGSDMLIMKTKPEYIKICEDLTRDIHLNRKNQRIITEIVSKCRHVNAQIIACSVESREEMETLILLGVDYLQGFYVGEPMAYLEDIPKALTKHILLFKQKRNSML